MRWIKWILVLAAAALAGCASKGPSSVLAEGPRMIDLYRGTAVEKPESAPRQEAAEPEEGPRCRWWLFTWPCEGGDAGSGTPAARAEAEAPYARTAANELELLFPRLPNPDIYIYVLPHLATEERVPVPGYTTAVPLYERVEYALPGESDAPERAP